MATYLLWSEARVWRRPGRPVWLASNLRLRGLRYPSRGSQRKRSEAAHFASSLATDSPGTWKPLGLSKSCRGEMVCWHLEWRESDCKDVPNKETGDQEVCRREANGNDSAGSRHLLQKVMNLIRNGEEFAVLEGHLESFTVVVEQGRWIRTGRRCDEIEQRFFIFNRHSFCTAITSTCGARAILAY